MNNEIKEILENIKNKHKDYYIQDILSNEQLKLLLGYITNLQTIEQQYSAILSENAELENKITNLQEENKVLKLQLDFIGEQNKHIDKLEKKIKDLQEELVESEEAVEYWQNQCDLRQRAIDKAIEYINNTTLFTEDYDYDYEENLVWKGATDEKEREELLNILQGEDKDE